MPPKVQTPSCYKYEGLDTVQASFYKSLEKGAFLKT